MSYTNTKHIRTAFIPLDRQIYKTALGIRRNKLKYPLTGFTLIELLVVVAIIGVLSSVVLASLGSARASAQDTFRKTSLKNLQTALELYRNDHGEYPDTGNRWWGVSDDGGNRDTSGPDAYIPGLAPQYISELPVDPKGDTANWSGFLYNSNGNSYKLLSHNNGPNKFPEEGEPFYDPRRPTWALMVCVGSSSFCEGR